MTTGLIFLVLLLACIAAGSTGALFPPDRWYRDLSKPGWTPPDWVFPVTWTLLYFCMAGAGARVAMLPGAGLAMALWSLQIALNGLWSPVFFGLHKIRAAMLVVVALWAAVALTMLALFQLDVIAGLLFVPYLVWVTIAAALNLSVMLRNPAPVAA